jgi:hypothetical protein
MFTVLARLHGLLFRLCLWLLRLPLQAIWAAFALVLAWLGEEFRRWAGLAASGALLVLAGKAVLNYAPPEVKKPLLLALLALLGIWALAVIRAARYTRFLIRANLQPVRTRQTFKRLFGKQAELGKQIQATRADIGRGMARRARGTPLEGWWGSNREDRAREAAQAEAAAVQAEAERAAAAEWDRAVAANRAERERFAREAAERWANRKQKGA